MSSLLAYSHLIMTDPNSKEKHVQDTLQRLACISKQLLDSSSFQHSARELLQWCSDIRAFNPVYEESLMKCLSIVSQSALLPEYDADLSYRLLAMCASQKDGFTAHSAAQLGQWSEELGQQLLLRHQRSQQQQSAELSTSMQQQMLRKQYSSDGSQMIWPQGDSPASSQGQHGLSVVTTVWGVAPPTQSNPPVSQPLSTASYNSGNMSTYNRPALSGYHPQQQPGYYRQNSASAPPGPVGHAHGTPGATLPHYRPQYNSGTNNPDYQPPPGALSAAAMVAAAATATATATATASMLVQEQQQYGGHPGQQQAPPPQPHPNGQYPISHRMPMHQQPGGMMPNQHHMVPSGQPQHMMTSALGPMPSQPNYRRPAPYPNAMQRRQQYPQHMGQPIPPQHGSQYGSPPASSAYSPQTGGMAPNSLYSSQGRPQLSLMMPGGQHMPQVQPGYAPRAPPPYGSNPTPYNAASTVRPGTPGMQPHPQQMHQHPQYQNGYVAHMQNTPSSPITPGTPMAPHYPGAPYQNMITDMKPEVKPHMMQPQNPGDLQLTFPVKDGIVLPPFRLQHNRSVSHHMFLLKDHVHHTLMERPDLELELKCFYHEDRHQITNWPASVSICVNDRTLYIERDEHKTNHKPLYLKEICMPGKNTITISVCACCCSHLFLLQLVQRPTIRSVLHGLLKKRLLNTEQCIAKIKRNFASFNGAMAPGDDSVEQTAVKISLKCPITYRRIVWPARGNECHHIECFDLESYLQMNVERGSWRCPVCSKTALLEGMEIDQYMYDILKKLQNTDVEEINIDANAHWKPNKPTHVKEEDSLDICGTNNWSKVYSPASTNLPSVSAYEGIHNPISPSPYPTPPNSHNSQGGGNMNQYNGGMYDVGFNSPPDFTAPLSNRSDIVDDKTDKRSRVNNGGIPPTAGINVGHSGPPSNKTAPSGPPSNAPGPASHGGPPSNLPASSSPGNMLSGTAEPPSNAPGSNIPSQGPPSNAPPSNQSAAAPLNQAELTADINDLINSGTTNDSLPLENLDDLDLLTYLGPNANSGNCNENPLDAEDELLALFSGNE